MPALALWIALFLGLSPTLVDLGRHWLSETWALPFAAFVPLWLLCAHGERGAAGGGVRAGRPVTRALALAAVAAALLVAAFATASGSTRLGRLAVPVAVVSLAVWLGRPSPTRALLAAWWIPLPHSLPQRVFPALSGAAEALSETLARATGGAPVYAAGALLPQSHPVRIGADDLGLAVCWLLAGWGWYLAARRGDGPAAAAGRALRVAALGLPLQLLALAVALSLAALGMPAAARAWLDAFLLVVLAGAGLWLLLGRRTGAPAPRLCHRLGSAR